MNGEERQPADVEHGKVDSGGKLRRGAARRAPACQVPAEQKAGSL